MLLCLSSFAYAQTLPIAISGYHNIDSWTGTGYALARASDNNISNLAQGILTYTQMTYRFDKNYTFDQISWYNYWSNGGGTCALTWALDSSTDNITYNNMLNQTTNLCTDPAIYLTYKNFTGLANNSGEYVRLHIYTNNGPTRIYEMNFTTSGEVVGNTNMTTLSFIDQTPITDITSTNLFTNYNLTIRYNITTNNGSIDNNNVKLWYKVNNSGCWIFLNGSCLNNGWLYDNVFSNVSSVYNFSLLAEHDIYPATYNYPSDYMNEQIKSIFNLTSSNHIVAIPFSNINYSRPYNILEMYFNATTVSNNVGANVYYCNSSYDFSSSIVTNKNCYLFTSINTNQTFNHSHSINSYHLILTMPIINNKIGTVNVTEKSYIVLRANNPSNVWALRYITNTSYVNNFLRSTNNGLTWINTSGLIADAHIHQYNYNQYLLYLVQTNSTGNSTLVNSTTKYDLIDLTAFSPTKVNIISPYSGYYTSREINITFIINNQ
jgi:hypothetical protein